MNNVKPWSINDSQRWLMDARQRDKRRVDTARSSLAMWLIEFDDEAAPVRLQASYRLFE